MMRALLTVGSVSWLLLGQAVDQAVRAADRASEIPGVGGVVAGVTASGILVWFLWYTVSRAQPRNEKRHADVIVAMAAKHENTVATLTVKYENALAVLAAKHESTIQRLEGMVDRLADRFTEEMRLERGANRRERSGQ